MGNFVLNLCPTKKTKTVVLSKNGCVRSSHEVTEIFQPLCCDTDKAILTIAPELTVNGSGFIVVDIIDIIKVGGKYDYYLEYDDADLVDPNDVLEQTDILAQICYDAIIDFILDTDFAQTDDWHVLGNAATVDGTSYAGTSDNVAWDNRVNNTRVRRNVPNATCNIIIDGHVDNNATGAGSSIGGGGTFVLGGDPQLIDMGFFSRICGGAGNSIVNDALGVVDEFENPPGASWIGGGLGNRVFTDFTENPTYHGKNVLGGGLLNQMQGSYGVIGGGSNNKITRANLPLLEFYAWNSILGGDGNEINASIDLDDDCFYNSVGGGFFNVITNEVAGTIGGGEENYIGPDLFEVDFSSSNSGDDNTIGGGAANTITHYAAAEGVIELSSNNTIGGGVGNDIVNQRDSVIAGGALSSIQPSTLNPSTLIMFNNFIGASYFGQLWGSRSSAIVSGREHDCFDQNSSAVLSGYINKITSTVPIKLDDPPLNAPSLANVISGGIFNSIVDGVGTAIIGGGNLRLGAYSAGYQSLATRAQALGFPFLVGPEIDLSAFPNIFFLGDVDLLIGNVNNSARGVKFFEPNTDKDFSSTHYSSFRAQAQSTNIDYVWPAALPSIGDVLTVAGVAGTTVTLEWA